MNDFEWLLKCVNVHVYSSSFRNVQERSQIDVVNVVRSIFKKSKVIIFIFQAYLLNLKAKFNNIMKYYNIYQVIKRNNLNDLKRH